jgi:hypothetical protein
VDIELVPALPEDLGSIYSLLTGPHVGWSRCVDFGPPNLRDFAETLQASCIELYQVHLVAADPIGICSIYDYTAADRTCWIDCSVHADFAHLWPAATTELVNRAFRDWGMRKVYGTSHGTEPTPFAGFSGCSLEALLRERWWNDGQYHDRRITALTAAVWETDMAISR